MGNGISVHVVLREPTVKSGGSIQGTVFVHSKYPKPFTSIDLELLCTEEAGSIGARHVLIQHSTELTEALTAHEDKILSGHHAYPFVIDLPHCPGSFDANVPDIMPNVKYTICGLVMRHGKVISKGLVKLIVIPETPITVEPLVESVTAASKPMNSPCWVKDGEVSITLLTDKNIYSTGDQLTTTLNVKNATIKSHVPMSIQLIRMFIIDGKIYRDIVDSATFSDLPPGKSMVDKVINFNLPKEYEYLQAQIQYYGNVHLIYYVEARAGKTCAKIPVHILLPGSDYGRPNVNYNWHPVEMEAQRVQIPSFTGSVRYNNERGAFSSQSGGSYVRHESETDSPTLNPAAPSLNPAPDQESEHPKETI